MNSRTNSTTTLKIPTTTKRHQPSNLNSKVPKQNMMYFLLVLIAALLLPSVEPILVSANSVPLENQSPSSDQYLESLEKSVAGIFQKVAYGTTSTTKRSIPDNYVPTLTTVATLPLTTERFTQSENANQKIRNFGIDRDHALPTSAPNADILKSNSNPSYPNPNRHHNRDRDNRFRHSTPAPRESSMKNKQLPSRAFFTPPLPPEYQSPFADKPTLRGTNNENGILSHESIGGGGSFQNRRPIPPPSLMPGHERIPLRPPDVVANTTMAPIKKIALNTEKNKSIGVGGGGGGASIPSISRILQGVNGDSGNIPKFLLQVTSRPGGNLQAIPIDPSLGGGRTRISNINERNNDEEADNEQDKIDIPVEKDGNGDDDDKPYEDKEKDVVSKFVELNNKKEKSPSSSMDGGDFIQTVTNKKEDGNSGTSIYGRDKEIKKVLLNEDANENTINSNSNNNLRNQEKSNQLPTKNHQKEEEKKWTIAWNLHIYITVIFFTILTVYTFFKLIFYNKLTHLFPQSYFFSINIILLIISSSRIFFLTYDAYNIHESFALFTSEIFLNLPSTFLTISFAILILFLLRKSLNSKNNRYSPIMRPLTVYVGGGVHVTLCITLHYVESYTTGRFLSSVAPTSSGAAAAPPIKILSLICQLFYIFICLFLGGLYMTLYPRLKRVLAAKNQNYIHEYSSFLYAIHITISTALLFVLMAALQMFGAFTISTARRASIDKDWLQWGYQFSLRLIELAIILLVSWVSGLKVGVSVEHELSTNHRHFKEIEPPSHYSEPMEFSRRVYDVYEIGATAGGPTTESSSSGSFGSRRRNDDVVSNCNAERTRLTVLGTAAQGLAPTPPPPPTTNGSMLVAECGFVRFRNLENMNFVGAGV